MLPGAFKAGSILFKFAYLVAMRRSLLLILFITGHFISTAQLADTLRIARAETPESILAPLIYLSSDALRGRHVGTPEIDTTAGYIARQFKRAGASPVPGAKGYFQPFNCLFSRTSRYLRADPQVAAGLSFTRPVPLKNVLAYVPGTDSVLRNQYVVLSSHYDHLGVSDQLRYENGKWDSIFNGARDNATGTAAVIAAAHYFARHPPRRSLLFICYTAEEEGLVGSEFYARHPLVPLDHSVYNLNVDNAGYNTTNAVCLFGLGRTSEDSLVYKACAAYGFAVLDDPTPWGLFKSSDNLSLAQKGVPAPTYSMGIKEWDARITDHYHQLSDETGNMDLDYVVKFIRAYILIAQYIADDAVQPRWTSGDPCEAAWLTLFHKPPR